MCAGVSCLGVLWLMPIADCKACAEKMSARALPRPPPAYARGQAAVGGAEPWPRVQSGVLRGLRAAAGL